MIMKRAQDKRNKPIAIIHAVLFVAFTVLFFAFFQRDLVALMQATWSRGQTLNNPLVTAAIVALVLIVLQWIVKLITRLGGRWEAFTWVPSYLLLGLTTSVDGASMHYDLRPWAFVVGGCVLMLLITKASTILSMPTSTPIRSACRPIICNAPSTLSAPLPPTPFSLLPAAGFAPTAFIPSSSPQRRRNAHVFRSC